jgi:hypothetical protein
LSYVVTYATKIRETDLSREMQAVELDLGEALDKLEQRNMLLDSIKTELVSIL